METIICYTDGGARGNPGPAGAGAVIADAEHNILEEVCEPLGNGTNNFAEYAAVLLALNTLKKRYGKKTKELIVEVRMDSELVKKQLSHEYQVKEPALIPQFIEIHNMHVKDFPHLTFVHIPREENTAADKLANDAMDNA